MKHQQNPLFSAFAQLRVDALVLVLSLGVAGIVSAQETPAATSSPASPAVSSSGSSTEPPHPGLTEYLGRTVAQTMHYTGAAWLIRTKRDREEAATLMRTKLELKPGMMVCDLGCGNGYHSFPMAKSVAPSGKVYGSWISTP